MSEDKPHSLKKKPLLSPLQGEILADVLAGIISAYAAWGVWRNDLSITYRFGRSGFSRSSFVDLHYRGISAWLMAAGIWLFAVGLVLLAREQRMGGRISKLMNGTSFKVVAAGMVLFSIMIIAGLTGITSRE